MVNVRHLFLVLLLVGLASACSDGSDMSAVGPVALPLPPERSLSGCAETNNCVSNPELVIGAERPAPVHIPTDYTPTTKYPLIVFLHGYSSANGVLQSSYLGLTQRVDAGQYVLVMPDGTKNTMGTQFWNATPACCAAVAEFEDGSGEDYTQVDDVAYVRSLIEEAAANFSVDVTKVGLFGYSNGAFMALRMVCEASDLVTSVVSLAGSTFAEAESCAPATFPVDVLAIHGDDDQTISYQGGEIGGALYPSAPETVGRFAELAGCDIANPVMGADIDVVASLDGDETSVLTYEDCRDDVTVELWTVANGPHTPFPWAPSGQDAYVEWLLGVDTD